MPQEQKVEIADLIGLTTLTVEKIRVVAETLDNDFFSPCANEVEKNKASYMAYYFDRAKTYHDILFDYIVELCETVGKADKIINNSGVSA